MKELSASAPAVADGTVYASTGPGLRGRRRPADRDDPRWFASYEIQPIASVDMWFTRAAALPARSRPPRPVVRGGPRCSSRPPTGATSTPSTARDGTAPVAAPYPRHRA